MFVVVNTKRAQSNFLKLKRRSRIETIFFLWWYPKYSPNIPGKEKRRKHTNPFIEHPWKGFYSINIHLKIILNKHPNSTYLIARCAVVFLKQQWSSSLPSYILLSMTRPLAGAMTMKRIIMLKQNCYRKVL